MKLFLITPLVMMACLYLLAEGRDPDKSSLATNPPPLFQMSPIHNTSADFCLVHGKKYDHNVDVDACSEMCKCSHGRLVDCACRRRKSFTKMTEEERVRYTDAVFDLSQGTGKATPELKSDYNKMVETHKNLGKLDVIHVMKVFLPFHRFFITKFEDLIRRVDCRVTVPYWDWATDAGRLSNKTNITPENTKRIWDSPLWGAGKGWLGGGHHGKCVTDGAFKAPFVVTPSADESGGSKCLRRLRKGTFPYLEDTEYLQGIPVKGFRDFVDTIRRMHGDIHIAVGGHMKFLDSANDPVFFMHHANIDRLWDSWQSKGPSYKRKYLSQAVKKMKVPGSAEGYTVGDLMDSNNYSNTCITYV